VPTRPFLSQFSPQRTDPETLERILVQRHELLRESVELLEESVRTANKHHLLFIGPRGAGKTHFLTLIHHRLKGKSALAKKLRIAWLNEDETSTTFFKLLLRIYRELAHGYPEEFPAAELEALKGRPPREAEAQLGATLLRHLGEKTVLVLVENLDALLEMPVEEARAWRAFIQNHPRFATAATAQRLAEGVSSRDQPFFGFFDTRTLAPLEAEEARTLLGRLAELDEDEALREFLATPKGRARAHAIHRLAGGNPRLYVIFSEFLTRETLDDLVRPFEETVDRQLTPYYQERMRWLSSQQREIVQFLCQVPHPVPVKEIAAGLFAPHNSITSQLKELRSIGYVSSHPQGREVYYEPAEPLMRLALQVKETRDRQPLRLIVDFLRVWFEREEIEERLGRLAAQDAGREYLEAAMAKMEPGERSMGHEVLRQAVEGADLKHCDDATLHTLRCLAAETNEPDDWNRLAEALYFREEFPGAIELFTRLIDERILSTEAAAVALFRRGFSFGATGQPEKEIADYTRVVELAGAPVAQIARALVNRGVRFGEQGEPEKEIVDYTRVVELAGAPVEPVAMALVNRGIRFGAQGEPEKEIADYTRVVELAGSPVEQVARALVNRGISFGEQGEPEKAITDYTRVVELAGAPVEQVAKALGNRGVRFGAVGEAEKAIADYLQLLNLPGWGEADAAIREWSPDLARKCVRGIFESRSRWAGTSVLFARGFARFGLLAGLGNALVRHLSDSGLKLLSEAGLEEWARSWENATLQLKEEERLPLEIPLRVLRAGLDYLATKGEGALLALPKEERAVAREALGLAKE
jgi:tetratricopeptide (TPR) repeat protein